MAVPNFQSILKPLLKYAAGQQVVLMSSAIEVFAALLEPRGRGCVNITPLGREWSKKHVAGFKIADLKTISGFNERVKPRAFKSKLGDTTIQVTVPGVDEAEGDEQPGEKAASFSKPSFTSLI